MTRTITLTVVVQELAHGSQIDFTITTTPPVPDGQSTVSTELAADLVACVERCAGNAAKEGK